MKIRCYKCRSIVNENDKFCTGCGEKLDKEKLIIEQPKEKKKGIKEPKKRILKLIVTIIVTAISAVLLTLGTLYVYDNYLTNNNINSFNKNVKIDDTGIADAVEKVYDSVVVVESMQGEQVYASGSGFVFKTDTTNGYILTNNHVVDGSSSVKVVFTDKKEVDADVVGIDEYADIAVLKVDKKYVKEVAITGKNSKMRVGDTTFAVGAPLDSSKYSWSVTRGILSGKDRTVSTGNSYMTVLQTDTPINSGNSGGPLCNANGEVIGITNMKLASEQIEGMGFAIPIETALDYANKFITGKTIKRPYVGVSIQEQSSWFSSTTRVIITGVEKGSPAEKAGLKSGDVIEKINDDEVENASYFKYKLYNYSVGDKVKITVLRDGKEKTFTVTLEENKA